MGAILAIDLAYTHYANFGVVLLESTSHQIQAKALRLFENIASAAPDPAVVARRLVITAAECGATALALDGSQAWKSPENGLTHQRLCERELAAPGKTGLPGECKPANYLPFIAFSIAVFDHLEQLGWPRLKTLENHPPRIALECFPTAAWKGLGFKPLPGKSASTPEIVQSKQQELLTQLNIHLRSPHLTHDELQALVGGIAALYFVDRRVSDYRCAGSAPFLLENQWREGWILNPVRNNTP